DQVAPINTITDGEQSRPVIEGSGGAGTFYVVAWSDGSGEIRSRFLGGASGFLFNSVTGQNDEFTATPLGSTGARSGAAVAVGGSGHVVIGWQDDSTGGLYARRFPLPASQ